MGAKPHKPIVPHEEAVSALTRSGEGPDAFRRLFTELSAGSGGHFITKEAFQKLLGESFARFGPDIVNRVCHVLDTDGNSTIDLKEFTVAMYVFRHGSKEQKLRVLFNVFDASGGGLISRKEFTSMSMAIIVGADRLAFDLITEDHDGFEKLETVGMEYFKPLVDLMVEVAFDEFDSDGDGKLSFAEWMVYAEEEPQVGKFLDAMTRIGVGRG